MTLRARLAARRGRRQEAIEHILRAWRVGGDEGMNPARRAWSANLIRVGTGGGSAPISRNNLLSEFVQSNEARTVRREFAPFPLSHRTAMKGPRPNDDPERQGDLIILKTDDERTGERGVVLVKYTEAIRRLPALFDLSAMARCFQVVLEPSSWGYQDATFFLYQGIDLDVLVQAPWRADFEYIRDLQSNLIPLRIGAGDWVDPDTFQPLGTHDRTYDVVMVSSWNPLKRHALLFRTIESIQRTRGRKLKVALIGYPQTWTKRNIESLARHYGVLDCCTIFESITHEEVARVVADSHAYVLLSLREGANKALYESLFCDTPVIVFRAHRGVNVEQISSDVGELVESDHHLADAILRAIDPAKVRRPRAWALENSGWRHATEIVNVALRDAALRRGLPWTRNIVAKKNAPNLRYADVGRYRDFDESYRRLGRFLRPVD